MFAKEREITIDGKTELIRMRQVILEQVARGAAKGDHKMIKMAIPFLKSMEDAPEFEVMPEDRKILQSFMNKFDKDGNQKDED